MKYPSDDIIALAASTPDGIVSAPVLCSRLETMGYKRPEAQLAMQRAVDKGLLSLRHDWTINGFRTDTSGFNPKHLELDNAKD